MRPEEKIIKILNEDNSLKGRLESMLKSKGVVLTSKSVGGVSNLVKILGLEMDDPKTQEMLVKNFIYEVELEGFDISFLEVDRTRTDKTRIKVYFETDDTAANVESWVARSLIDEINKFFPFTIMAAWEPVFAGRNVKVILDAKKIDNTEEDNDFIMENDNKLKIIKELNPPNFLLRRVNLDVLSNRFMNSLDYAINVFKGRTRRNSLTNFKVLVITDLMEGIHPLLQRNSMVDDIYNDDNLYSKISDFLYEYFDQDIKNAYEELVNDMGIQESLEDKWNTGNKHGNKYDYQHGFCHYFAYNIIGKLKKLYPEKNIRYYLILADEVYDFDEGDVEQSYLIHAYIKIDDLYLDSEGFSTENEIEERTEDWYQRQLIELPEDYRIDIWHDEYDHIPENFFNNQFCNTGMIKKDIEKFLSHPEVKELLKTNINESSDKPKEETTNSGKENLLKLKEKIGFVKALKAVGGLENYIRIIYNGDIKKFFEDNDIKPYYITAEPNLYIADIIVQSLDLPDAPFGGGREKELGDFSWVSGGIRYKFTAYLRRMEFASGKIEWRVVGQSGDSGFGYSFITQRNTLRKRARMQIFKQIIDKYNLEKYV